ncbi:MAG: RNB domain-containing ribonuclease, partial [Candidatus Eremiobacterota bacterium]
CASKKLKSLGFPTLQRIVREPKYWDRIVDLAGEYGVELPRKPDSAALERFLEGQRKSDPLHFPDLSLNVVKLLGRGEYVVQMPNEPPIGHFGLAVAEYSHSTAPNRRYPDVITQRLLKAALAGEECPYTGDELKALALRCTEMEAAAEKVERQIQKSAGALMLSTRVGESFEAVVSGVNDKGTWVRVLDPPVEGKLEGGGKVRMGQLLDVRLTGVNVERGFIDFEVDR